MTSFWKVLELDQVNLDGKYVSIHEEHGGEANFVLNCFISECLSRGDNGLCILSLHNSYEHYLYSGLKLGHNINSNSDKIVFIEPSKCMFEDNNFNFMKDLSCNDNVKSLLNCLKDNCDNLLSKYQRVFLLIDNLTDLLNVGASEKNIKLLVHYLKSCLKNRLTLVTLSQYSIEDSEQLTIKNFLSYISDIQLNISPLHTGLSKDVSGTLTLNKKDDSFEHFTKNVLYHYKISDRNVKIFPPGNI